ncbi:MAG: pseudouridine-5'-phosphate glycosidase [Anaerolineae bacterium]
MTSWSSKGAAALLSPEVSLALARGGPVVALESALITHGLPQPENLSVAQEMERIVAEEGAVPATVAILKGQPRVGLSEAELQALAGSQQVVKASLRDLPVLALRGLDGGTTVAATAWLAAKAGVRVLATGGIGGVHRGASGDVSADLPVLASTPIVVVCAGAKAILDLHRTWEWLETHGVLVVGYRTDEVPAFYCRASGLPVSARVETPEEVAELARRQWGLGLEKALVVGVPVPEEAAIPREQVEAATEEATRDAEACGIWGKALTPFLLARVSKLTGGESLRANQALLLQNAAVAAQVALSLLKKPVF